MRIHIIMREPHSDPEPYLFRSPLVESRLGLLPLAGSTAVHAAATGLIWFVAAHLSWFGNYTVAWQAAYRVDPIRLRVPEPIYYRPAPAPKKQASRPRPARGRTRPAEPGGSQQAAAAAAPAAPARRSFVAPQIELPATRNASNEPDVILQPAMPLQAAPPTTTVPALAFWARQTPEVPKPRRRELVIPGRAETPAAPPSLDAPPVLAIPNREPVLSDINMALTPYTGPARLTVANSSTAPIRVKNSQGEPQAGSFEMSQGSPVNLIAITGAVRPAGNVIEVPRGLQRLPATGGGNGAAESGATPGDGDPSHGGTGQGQGRTAGAGAGAGGTSQARAGQGTGAGTGSGTGSGSGSRSGAGSGAGSGSGPGTGAGKGSGSGSNAAQSGTGTGNSRGGSGVGSSSGTGTGSGSGNGAGVGTNRAAAARPVAQATPENADVTRIVHPANGVFDVVIMQSTVRDDMPETAGLLSGSPVYTVYLRVGDQREWLLEYCIPSAAKPQSTYQIDVSDPGEIAPPYPMTTVVPNAVWGQRSTRYIVLHGFITAAGRLRNVTTAAGTAHALARQLLPALPEWQFRPALQNRKPIEVEILLLIPPRS